MSRRRTPAPSRTVVKESTPTHGAGALASASGGEASGRAERLRVLVFTTQSGWSAGTRLFAMLATALHERGVRVSIVCCRRGATERALMRDYPELSRRTVSARSLLRRVGELRTIVRAEHPAAILVQSDRDELAAALAIGREGAVVRRLRVGETLRRGWTARVATARARCVLVADERVAGVQRGAIGWPSAEAMMANGTRADGTRADGTRADGTRADGTTGGGTTGGPTGGGTKVETRSGDGFRIAPTMPPPTIAIVAARAPEASVSRECTAREHAAGALALRAAARLLSRHPELRVQLMGDASALQALRLHAGSLGLAERLSVLPLEALLDGAAFEAAIAWIVLEGDDGAAATLAAMSRRIPVVVPRGSDLQHFVAPRISGFLAEEGELPALVSSLAHLLADGEEFRAMGTAAASRADRLHGWNAFVSRVESTLRHATEGTHSARPPSRTPTSGMPTSGMPTSGMPR